MVDARPSAHDGAMTSNRTATIAVACLATAMLMLDISVVNTALSDIAAGLSTDLSGLQWVVDAYTLPLAATVLTAGVLADRHGRRRLFVLGLALFTLASAACGLAGSIETLVAARAVQGIGASIMFATALALIAQVSQGEGERVKALAVYGATIGAAFAIGPFVGGALTSAVGWRAIFLINVPLGLASIWIARRSVAETRDPLARGVDLPGQVTLIGGLFLVVLGLLRGNEDGWGSAGIVAALGAGVALLGLFAIAEWRGRDPMLPLGLLRDRTFAGAQIAVFGISGSFFAGFLYMTLYLQGVVGLSPIETGLAYLPATATIFVVSGASASLGAKVRPGILISAGLTLISAGMALMLLADVGSSWTAILPGEMLAALGTGLFNPAASAVALAALPEERSGLAAGANDTFRQAGTALGIAGLGAFVPVGLGGSPVAFVDGFHDAMLAASALAAVAAVATAWLLVREPAGAPVLAPEPA